MASWAPNVPQPPFEPPYLSPLEVEALEGGVGSWRRGGGEGAPWRPHEWGERGRLQWPPNIENQVPYGVSGMESSGRPWLPPEEDKGVASWGGTDGDVWGPPRESLTAEREGRIGSWEPPQDTVGSPPMGGWLRVPLSPPRKDPWEPPPKRAGSPPMGAWQRVPLSPPRGRGWTGPDPPGQPSCPSTHCMPMSSGSEWDPPEKAGSPCVSQSWWDGPATEPTGSFQKSPVPAKTWESCCGPEMLQPACGRAVEGRDPERLGWSEELGVSSSSSGGDPLQETRQGNPVDQSYSVKAGGSGEHWSGRGFQSSQIKIDSSERGKRGPKGRRNKRWARDGGQKGQVSKQGQGHSMGFPRQNFPRKGQGRFQGPGTQSATRRTWFPRPELVEYWTQCHHVMRKKVRDKFLSFCPRPTIPDGSSVPPVMNPDLAPLIGKHAKHAMRFPLLTQREVLDMLAPIMAIYEMTEAAIERQAEVDAPAVRKLASCLLSFTRSTNRRLTLQRCSYVLQAIDPRLMAVISRMLGQNPGGLLFMEKEVNLLKRIMHSLPKVPEEPPEMPEEPPEEPLFGHPQEAGRPPIIIASPPESCPPVQDGAAPLSEQNSDPQAPLQDGASLKLWHRRFGHVDPAAILRLQKAKLATGIQVDPGEAESTARCVTCLTERSHKPPFSLNIVRSSSASMDLIQCELSGPFNVPSLTLQQYVLIFVDDFSRFCMTFLLRETGEAHGCFEEYLAMLSEKRKQKPKAFQLNSAADAVPPRTIALLDAQGIAHKRGIRGINGQRRTAKKEMKALLEMTRCMLADAKLPDPFWGHAILTATYLWNLVVFSRRRKTPFRDWHGRVPDVKHLRVFGSLVHDLGPAQQVLVGYGTGGTEYRIMNLETGAVWTKRALDFNEQKGAKKRGRLLEAVERHGCNLESSAGRSVPVTPQPEMYSTLAHAETCEETHRPGME